MRYWSHPPYTKRAQAEARIAEILQQQRDTDVFCWVITRPSSDQLIGNLTLFNVSRPHLRCELGYSLLPAHQGQGLAQEAVRAALSYAFDSLAMERIEADIDPRNAASRRLVERLGFQLEGTLRAKWRVAGEVCDTSLYGLLRGELTLAKAPR